MVYKVDDLRNASKAMPTSCVGALWLCLGVLAVQGHYKPAVNDGKAGSVAR
jgi:hypothetical protein